MLESSPNNVSKPRFNYPQLGTVRRYISDWRGDDCLSQHWQLPLQDVPLTVFIDALDALLNIS